MTKENRNSIDLRCHFFFNSKMLHSKLILLLWDIRKSNSSITEDGRFPVFSIVRINTYSLETNRNHISVKDFQELLGKWSIHPLMVNNDLPPLRCHRLHLYPGIADLSEFVLSGKLCFTYFKRIKNKSPSFSCYYYLLRWTVLKYIYLTGRILHNFSWLIWKIAVIWSM